MSDWSNLATVGVAGGLGVPGTLAGVVFTQRRQDRRDRKADAAHLRDVRVARLHAAYAEAVGAGKDAIVLADALLVALAHKTEPSDDDWSRSLERLRHGEALLMLEPDAIEPLELVGKIWLDFVVYRNHLHDGDVGKREAARDAMKAGLEALARYAREHLPRLEQPIWRPGGEGAGPLR